MMTALTFDTHQFVKSLVASGITETQAEALVAELSEVQLTNVATRLDIADVRRELSELRSAIALMEQRLIVRLGGLMAVGIGLLAVLQQFG